MQTELHRMKLCNRARWQDETLPELAEDMERLPRLAYPEAPVEVLETLTKDQFIDALNDDETHLRVAQARPTSLRAALGTALEIESFSLAARRRAWPVRRVHESLSDGEGEELPPSREPPNADSAEGDQSARLEPDNSKDLLPFDIAQEDTGHPILQKLADINKRWSEKLAKHKLHEKRDKYPHPTNCKHVIVIRVNPEIWAQIDHNAKQLDLKESSIRTNLVKVGAILARSTDMVLSFTQTEVTSSEIKALITLNTDAMALLGHALCNLSQ